MNRPLLTGLMISAAFVTTGAAVAGLGLNAPRYADVVEVQPAYVAKRVTREVCATAKPAARTAGRTAEGSGQPVAKRSARCRTVHATERRPAGWDVTYRLGRDLHTVRMDHRPGERLRIERGVPQLAQARPER